MSINHIILNKVGSTADQVNSPSLTCDIVDNTCILSVIVKVGYLADTALTFLNPILISFFFIFF